MTRQEIIQALERTAFLLQLKGANPFKVRAYMAAARTIETMSDDPVELISKQGSDGIPGIGATMAAKLNTLIRQGTLPQLAELLREFPSTLFDLLEIEGLGPKKIKTLHDQLGVTSIEALEKACADGRVAELSGFGPRSASNILVAIQRRRQNSGLFLPYTVESEVDYVLDQLRNHPACGQVAVAGSFRRGCETLRNLYFVASSKSPESLTKAFLALPVVTESLSCENHRCSGRFQSGIEARLEIAAYAEFPLTLNWFTGSTSHTERLQQLAQERGWSLKMSRLEAAPGSPPPPPIEDEDQLYAALGLCPIPPELRENLGEIEAARQNSLPALVELPNLRGTFHVHTRASDGRGSLHEMAETAMALGFQYLGISDHSKSSYQANGLNEDRLIAQIEEIQAFNRTVSGFRLFSGVECDILKDGSLDFPDEILDLLDFVVVSVHSFFTMDRVKMTDRIIKAISNPHATFLGHMTGRLLTRRDPYEVDLPAVIRAAAQTGTIIEFNCTPQRMDLDWRWWREAKEKGVLCSINTDAHSPEGLGTLWAGLRTVRKGWLTRKDVVNSLPLGQIEEVLAKKKQLAGVS